MSEKEVFKDKKKAKKNKSLPLIFSALAVLISLIGVVYQNQQTVLLHQQSEVSVHGMLIERNSRILELLLENPELRPYFYDNVELPENKNVSGKALTLAEMWTDFFEQVLIQAENLPPDMAPTWKEYAADMHSTSPAIRDYFSSSCSWYHELLRELWECEEELTQ